MLSSIFFNYHFLFHLGKKKIPPSTEIKKKTKNKKQKTKNKKQKTKNKKKKTKKKKKSALIKNLNKEVELLRRKLTTQAQEIEDLKTKRKEFRISHYLGDDKSLDH